MSVKRVLERYIVGKDDDQYQILEAIYTQDAVVEFVIETEAISFPETIEGHKEIARVLSKEFNEKYEHVKTYYLTSVNEELSIKEHPWLVLMREKATGFVRIGVGVYDWYLEDVEEAMKIKKHVITIKEMIVLEAMSKEELVKLQEQFAYPWCLEKEVRCVLEQDTRFASICLHVKKAY